MYTVNSSMADVRVLSLRMVSPNNDVFDSSHRGAKLFSNLSDSSVMIESSECGEVFLGN